MQITGIKLARVIAFVDILELNPAGQVFLPSLVQPLAKKFNFQKFPAGFEQLDLSEGVEFEQGYAGNSTIAKLSFFNDGITLDGTASSAASKEALLGALQWLSDEYGLKFSPSKILRWGYVSSIFFHSEATLTMLNPALQAVCDKISAIMADLGRDFSEYRATKLWIDLDRHLKPQPLAAFIIEKAANHSFAENRYFSEGPFPSDILIGLIEDLETALLEGK